MTVAVGCTSVAVHVDEYDPNMTFLQLIEKVIEKYPFYKENPKVPICPNNTLLSLGGRVFYNRNERFVEHGILDGSLFGMTAGVHAKNKSCCVKLS
mmetsp:Transcript_10726/g.30121  ORF Transcript_10726/g.30121 Transcript_10726/m.30121 type:complete len:96 (+) Transcript_10726:172-459(+)